ncbi:disulfide bond formation protein B [Spiribacter vilamensis]|uniref:Disulfide bond formation protein B n=1 Tax=Spiribacter vilamensis TaxID=531306 RepID=A0A4Q8CYH8_9GAMM|nr:disulfide bond formation protein B [Spiribacter vilamensis]RZU98046.1 disulfide bond formation protein DsbB [Spiribacter vilamensis]TVO61050.1 disulfide bond formation protein B [Spiribacter vilamensis]
MIAFIRHQWRQPARVNLFIALICFALVGVALLLEAIGGMEPCPLCVFQRIAFLVIGAVLLVGVFFPGRIVAASSLVGVAAGIGLAWRHLWLQSLPADQVPACGPGLDYLVGVFPMTEVIGMVLAGSGECAEVDRVLGVSIPLWTLLIYALLGAVAIYVNLGAGRRAVQR